MLDHLSSYQIIEKNKNNPLLLNKKFYLTPDFLVNALNISSKDSLLLKNIIQKVQSYYYPNDNQLKVARVLAENYPNLTNLIFYGKILDQNNMSLEAINFFECALLKKPDNPNILFQIYNFLGNAYLRIQDFESAEENYHKAFSINPHHSQLYVNLGTLAIQKNDWFLVQNYFREALKYNINNDKAWTGLGIYHKYMGDLELALATIKKSLDINPVNKPSILLLAQWNHHEKIKETILYVSKYIDLNHFDEEISLLFIHLCSLNQDFSLASIEIEKLICLNSQNPYYYKIYKEILGAINESTGLSHNSIEAN